MTLISKIDEKHIDKNEIKKQAEILKKGKVPIVVGGTGLYFQQKQFLELEQML